MHGKEQGVSEYNSIKRGGELLYEDRDNIVNIQRLKMKSNGLYRIWFGSRKIRNVCPQSPPFSLPLSVSLSSPLLSPLMVFVLHILVRPRFPLCSFSSVDSQSVFLSHSSMCGASSCFDPELHNLSLRSSPVAGAPGSHPWKLTLWNELSLNQL